MTDIYRGEISAKFEGRNLWSELKPGANVYIIGSETYGYIPFTSSFALPAKLRWITVTGILHPQLDPLQFICIL
jgi:hypothetical protein